MGTKKRDMKSGGGKGVAINSRPPISRGVIIFGVLLVVSSLLHAQKLAMEKQLYFHYYSYLPAGMAAIRYAFSWLQRICGIISGVGILTRKEFARKLGFAIGWFTILTVYWKHPYPAVQLHTEYLDKQFGYILAATGTGVTFQSITPLAVFALYACDIAFWAIFFYFFTRPPVRAQFAAQQR